MAKLNQVDVYFVARELDEMLSGARLDNAYEYEDGRVRLKFRHERLGVRHVLIEPGVTVHATEWVEEPPESPPAFAAAIRKHLQNGVLTSVTQVNFDKLLIFHFSKASDFELVVELYGSGNAMLLSSGPRQILSAWRYEKGGKSREIVPKKSYAFPSSPAKSHFRDFDSKGLAARLHPPYDKALFDESDLPKECARVALIRAGIDNNAPRENVGPVQWEALERVLKELLERPSPRIVTGGDAGPRYSSFETPLNETENEIVFTSLSEALDAYDRAVLEWKAEHPQDESAKTLGQSRLGVTAKRKEKAAPARQKGEVEIRKVELALEQQKKALDELTAEEAQAKRAGEWLYNNYALADELANKLNAGASEAELEKLAKARNAAVKVTKPGKGIEIELA